MITELKFYKPITIILVAVLLLLPFSAGAVTQTITADADDDTYIPELTDWFSSFSLVNVVGMGSESDQNYHIALRFQDMNVAQGATISSATLRLYIGAGTGGFVGNLYGNDTDNAAAWGGSVTPDSVTKTSALTSVTVIPPIIDSEQLDFDVTDILQEVVNRGGWTSGNALAIVSDSTGVTSGANVGFYSREGSFASTTDYSIAPTLIIETASPPARELRLKGGMRLMNGVRLR